MRLTTYTDYSLRVLIRLALRPGELATIGEIARVYAISEHHLMKVVHQLGLAGYVETVRGRGGGLRLAKRPDEINVGEVVRRMEPDFGVVACFRGSRTCAIESACVLAEALDQALAAFIKVLDGFTLADLVRKPGPLGALLKLKPQDGARVRINH
ncbi:MAG: Rrf2 family transcriptional regulator [Gammaproteobacteria bacterium]|nr:Rrf2 family transcriptional regulator [Gammaproteobacteria bacterium]